MKVFLTMNHLKLLSLNKHASLRNFLELIMLRTLQNLEESDYA